MKRVVIVQARMTSTRLPGKVLLPVAGRPLLWHLLRRLRDVREADEIVVATTSSASDDPVVDLCRESATRWFRGEEADVLGRYAGAAREAHADLVVRVTADCPLLDAAVCDRVIRELASGAGDLDYATNTIRRTWPRGLDVEAFFRDALERMDRLGRSPEAREHVTWFLVGERPDLFLARSVEDGEDNSDLRWTVDVAEDLELVRRIYEGAGLADAPRPYAEVLAWVRAHPEVSRLNAAIAQKSP